jgi:hypothetical protein
VGQRFAAFDERVLHFDHAPADLNPGCEFTSIKGLNHVVVGPGAQ